MTGFGETALLLLTLFTGDDRTSCGDFGFDLLADFGEAALRPRLLTRFTGDEAASLGDFRGDFFADFGEAALRLLTRFTGDDVA